MAGRMEELKNCPWSCLFVGKGNLLSHGLWLANLQHFTTSWEEAWGRATLKETAGEQVAALEGSWEHLCLAPAAPCQIKTKWGGGKASCVSCQEGEHGAGSNCPETWVAAEQGTGPGHRNTQRPYLRHPLPAPASASVGNSPWLNALPLSC